MLEKITILRQQSVSLFLLALIALLMLVFIANSASFAQNKLRIIALGDSLTAGFGLKQGEAFPDQLQKALQAQSIDAIVENAGVSGDTTSGGLARLDWALGGEKAPDLVIVELGANDALRGLSIDNTNENLSKILQVLKDKQIPTLLAGMRAPPNMGSDYADKFDTLYPELAQQFGAYLYPFFLEGVAANAELNLPDGIHPTSKGIGIIVDKMLPDVLAALGKIKG